MIIDGKRHVSLSVWKDKGTQSYFLLHIDVDSSYASAVVPFWAKITTKELSEEPVKSRRFFQQLIPEDQYTVIGVTGRIAGYTSNAYMVSWNKTPPVWRKFFLNALEKENWFGKKETGKS